MAAAEGSSGSGGSSAAGSPAKAWEREEEVEHRKAGGRVS